MYYNDAYHLCKLQECIQKLLIKTIFTSMVIHTGTYKSYPLPLYDKLFKILIVHKTFTKLQSKVVVSKKVFNCNSEG